MFDSSKILTKLVFLLFFCFVNCGNSTCKSGSLRRPHPTYPIGAFEHTFLTLQKKLLLSRLHMISVHARVRKPFQKKCKKFGTGSRMGATPGRLVAQNRWFLKGFRPQGSLHRTRGRDRPGAHFACC